MCPRVDCTIQWGNYHVRVISLFSTWWRVFRALQCDHVTWNVLCATVKKYWGPPVRMTYSELYNNKIMFYLLYICKRLKVFIWVIVAFKIICDLFIYFKHMLFSSWSWEFLSSESVWSSKFLVFLSDNSLILCSSWVSNSNCFFFLYDELISN